MFAPREVSEKDSYRKQKETMIATASAPPAYLDDTTPTSSEYGGSNVTQSHQYLQQQQIMERERQWQQQQQQQYTSIPQPATTKTKLLSGYNKRYRDRAKLVLVFVALALFFEYNRLALFASGGAIYFLKRGTLMSTKNLKWGALSFISTMVSAFGYFWDQGTEKMNIHYLYRQKLYYWIVANCLSGIWSVVLGLFLLSAFTKQDKQAAARRPTSNNPMYTAQPTKHFKTY